jgi:hypothetical protein
MRRLLALLTLLVLAATPAVAADPENGKVSRATPKASWTGKITSFQSFTTYNAGQGRCVSPSCDTFTLEVADGPAPLKLTVESGDSAVIFEVVKPDGEKEQFGDATAMKVTGTIKNAANGTYTINVAQNEQTEATHKGTAELVFPAKPSTPPPATIPPPATTPTPAEQPASTAPPTISLGARKLKKKVLPISISSSAPVSEVAATLKRGGKTVAKGSLERVESNGLIKLKFKSKPRRGRYTLKVTGLDDQGRSVTKSLRVKI